jgi:hypothetical protein
MNPSSKLMLNHALYTCLNHFQEVNVSWMLSCRQPLAGKQFRSCTDNYLTNMDFGLQVCGRL